MRGRAYGFFFLRRCINADRARARARAIYAHGDRDRDDDDDCDDRDDRDDSRRIVSCAGRRIA